MLERERLPIDYIAGSSAGALVGALFCAGFTSEQLQKLVEYFGWRQIASLVWPRQGLVRCDKLERWLEKHLRGVLKLTREVHFEDLKLPFAVVTTDIGTGKPVVICKGPVVPAVLASCSVPGFVVPTEIDERLLCDGSVSCHLPVKAARGLGAKFVIGVDLFQPKLHKRRGLLDMITFALQTLVKSSGGGHEDADFMIEPELAGMSYLRFNRSAELIERGKRAAEDALHDLDTKLAARAHSKDEAACVVRIG